MHTSGFDDAANESRMIEGIAGERLRDLLPPSGDHPAVDRWTGAGRMTTLGLFVAALLPRSRAWKSEDALQQPNCGPSKQCAQMLPVPMKREISGH
jgi:hypothetical protein